MVAVIKGDIIASRKLKDQDKWLNPLQELLGQWGKRPKDWELVWGDFFQLEVKRPEEALKKALAIKALIKRIEPLDAQKRISTIDVRMAIGIGEKSFSGKRISESNGSAFIHAGECFTKLQKAKVNLAVQSPWTELDAELNLYLKLAGSFMDSWSVTSAELIALVLESPKVNQEEIGKALGIKQSGVSGRWKRSHIDEVLEVEKAFRQKLKKRLS